MDQTVKHNTAITSVSFYGFDLPHVWADQPADVYRYTEKNYPVRKTLSAHIQSKIPKCFGWQLAPGYENYIYIDACYIVKEGATEYMLSELGDNDIVVFQHPFRTKIIQEIDFMKEYLPIRRYLRRRYQFELLEEQWKVIADDKDYVDDTLLHAAIFAYKNNEKTQGLLKEWWYHISRYHVDDQFSFPYVIKKSGCKYKVIPTVIPHLRKYFRFVNHAL